MPVTPEQAHMLASLAADCRPHGARRWDAPGVVAAIKAVSHLSLADVALAVIRAADDANLDTPGPIRKPSSSCWRERNPDRQVVRKPFTPANTCGICGKQEPECAAISPDISGHTFQSTNDTRRNARTAPEETP